LTPTETRAPRIFQSALDIGKVPHFESYVKQNLNKPDIHKLICVFLTPAKFWL